MLKLETAILLKESGFSATKSQLAKFTDGSYGAYNGGTYDELYPCPSLEELLAELPFEITYKGGDGTTDACLNLGKGSKSYTAFYQQPNGIIEFYVLNPDPAEACALLWLKLRKEGLL